MLETLDYTIRIGSTPTILYFDLNKVKLANMNNVELAMQNVGVRYKKMHKQ